MGAPWREAGRRAGERCRCRDEEPRKDMAHSSEGHPVQGPGSPPGPSGPFHGAPVSSGAEASSPQKWEALGLKWP